MKIYRVDYSNEKLGLEDEFDIIHAESDKSATSEALADEKYEIIWDIVELDEDYNKIRSIW